MKLKNKKTGEIGNLLPYGCEDGKIRVWIGNISRPEYRYSSLADLNAEWEDAPKEPKEHWYISDFGFILKNVINDKSVKSTIEEMKSIGNYFETEEEAEKAVEKLRAYKRLKDKGFRFVGRAIKDLTITYSFDSYDESDIPQMNKDLDLLFCREEKNE